MVPYFLTASAAETAGRLRERGAVTVQFSSRHTIRLQPSAATLACLAMVDGVRSLSRIWAEAGRALTMPAADVAAAVAPEFDRFNALNWLFLRHQDCPAPPMLAYAFRGDAANAAPDA
jgi:hypothetical protein